MPDDEWREVELPDQLKQISNGQSEAVGHDLRRSGRRRPRVTGAASARSPTVRSGPTRRPRTSGRAPRAGWLIEGVCLAGDVGGRGLGPPARDGGGGPRPVLPGPGRSTARPAAGSPPSPPMPRRWAEARPTSPAARTSSSSTTARPCARSSTSGLAAAGGPPPRRPATTPTPRGSGPVRSSSSSTPRLRPWATTRRPTPGGASKGRPPRGVNPVWTGDAVVGWPGRTDTPVQLRGRERLTGQGRAHGDVGDAVLEVLGAGDPEAEGLVPGDQVGLGVGDDGAVVVGEHALDQRLGQAGAAGVGAGDHPADADPAAGLGQGAQVGGGRRRRRSTNGARCPARCPGRPAPGRGRPARPRTRRCAASAGRRGWGRRGRTARRCGGSSGRVSPVRCRHGSTLGGEGHRDRGHRPRSVHGDGAVGHGRGRDPRRPVGGRQGRRPRRPAPRRPHPGPALGRPGPEAPRRRRDPAQAGRGSRRAGRGLPPRRGRAPGLRARRLPRPQPQR